MKIFIRKKYLVVPVGTYATNKKLCFYESAGSEKTLSWTLTVRKGYSAVENRLEDL